MPRLFLASGSVPLVILLFICGAFDAKGECRFRHWTIAEGSPQNKVQAFLQTRDGYLWIYITSVASATDLSASTTQNVPCN